MRCHVHDVDNTYLHIYSIYVGVRHKIFSFGRTARVIIIIFVILTLPWNPGYLASRGWFFFAGMWDSMHAMLSMAQIWDIPGNLERMATLDAASGNNKWSNNFDERPHSRLDTPPGCKWIGPTLPAQLLPGSLEPHESAPKTACWSVHLFLYSSPVSVLFGQEIRTISKISKVRYNGLQA